MSCSVVMFFDNFQGCSGSDVMFSLPPSNSTRHRARRSTVMPGATLRGHSLRDEPRDWAVGEMDSSNYLIRGCREVFCDLERDPSYLGYRIMGYMRI